MKYYDFWILKRPKGQKRGKYKILPTWALFCPFKFLISFIKFLFLIYLILLTNLQKGFTRKTIFLLTLLTIFENYSYLRKNKSSVNETSILRVFRPQTLLQQDSSVTIRDFSLPDIRTYIILVYSYHLFVKNWSFSSTSGVLNFTNSWEGWGGTNWITILSREKVFQISEWSD